MWFFRRCQTGLDWKFYSGMNYTCLGACIGSNTVGSEMRCCWVLLKCKQQINKKVKLVTAQRLLPINSMTLAGCTLVCTVCENTWQSTVVYCQGGAGFSVSKFYNGNLWDASLPLSWTCQTTSPWPLASPALFLLGKKVSMSLNALLIPTTVVCRK